MSNDVAKIYFHLFLIYRLQTNGGCAILISSQRRTIEGREMKPAISIKQAAKHGACGSGLINFIKHYLPDYDFTAFENGDIYGDDLVDSIAGLVDVDAPRELHTLDNNSVANLIWALRRTSVPGSTVIDICRKTAIFAAESVLHIFEMKHPDDKRPRKAIEAAKAYLKGDINRDELREARVAAAAADAAADAAAADAAAADAAAADAAAYAADAAAADDAADAAAAAYAAADDAAYAAYAYAYAAIKKQIRDYFNAQLMAVEV